MGGKGDSSAESGKYGVPFSLSSIDTNHKPLTNGEAQAQQARDLVEPDFLHPQRLSITVPVFYTTLGKFISILPEIAERHLVAPSGDCALDPRRISRGYDSPIAKSQLWLLFCHVPQW